MKLTKMFIKRGVKNWLVRLNAEDQESTCPFYLVHRRSWARGTIGHIRYRKYHTLLHKALCAYAPCRSIFPGDVTLGCEMTCPCQKYRRAYVVAAAKRYLRKLKGR